MATPSTNGADPGRGGRSEPRRLRWSVPAVDVSTNRWLDLQNDISHSLQLLIRESIQRDGYIDVVNRPIEQLPRRGRPPQGEPSASSEDEDASDGADGGFFESAAQASPEAREELPEKTSAGVEAQREAQAAQTPPAADEDEVVEPVEQTAPAEEEHGSPAQPGKSGLDAFLTS